MAAKNKTKAPKKAAKQVRDAQVPEVQTPAPEQPTDPVQTPAPEPAAPEQPAEVQTPAAAPAKGKRARKEKKAKGAGTDKKLSALDAAAKVLAKADGPLSSQELIGAMAAKGYWSSPAGKTPHATLYAAILREIQTKGQAARFVKADRGKFALRANGSEQ